MAAQRSVAFYLDFISPYSWMALMQAEAFAAEHGVRWEIRPVVYAALLDAHGLVGPAETPAKRRYTFHDVVRSASRLGLRCAGPPAHPFRSLEALRTLYLFRREPAAARLAARLADACWGEGRALTDPAVICEVVEGVGLPAGDLERRIVEPEVKRGLRELTEEAVGLGVFGVPTFVTEGELFWGHDRMGQLAERLSGRLPAVAATAEALLVRPRGADRRGAPPRRPPGPGAT